MTDGAEANRLQSVLTWNPHIIYDPVPEWWLRGADKNAVAELLALRLETQQQIMQIHAESLGKAADMLRKG